MSKLLIVDDSSIQRSLIEKAFQNFGITNVYHAQNGIEAIQMVIKYNPDLITMDIIMPEMDGIRCISEILKIKKDAIIFVITVLSDPSTSLEVIKKGAKGIFLKPVNQLKLERAVKQFLSRV